MPQGSIQWQGTQRRACGPGAHWNVQVRRRMLMKIRGRYRMYHGIHSAEIGTLYRPRLIAITLASRSTAGREGGMAEWEKGDRARACIRRHVHVHTHRRRIRVHSLQITISIIVHKFCHREPAERERERLLPIPFERQFKREFFPPEQTQTQSCGRAAAKVFSLLCRGNVSVVIDEKKRKWNRRIARSAIPRGKLIRGESWTGQLNRPSR